MIEVGVSLSPLPTAQQLDHPIEPEGFPRPLQFGDRLLPFCDYQSFGFGLVTDAALILSQIRKSILGRYNSPDLLN